MEGQAARLARLAATNADNRARAEVLRAALPFLRVTFESATLPPVLYQVDLATGRILHVGSGQTFQAQAPSPLITALTREGGLVPAIRHHGKAVFSALTGS